MKLNQVVFTKAILLLFCVSSALAQEESIGSFKFGAKAGAVISRFDNAQPHTSERLGLTIGAVVEYGINDMLSVQAEPAYLQQGGKFVRFSDNTRFGDYDAFNSFYVTNANVTIHTIDLPVLAKFWLPFGKEVNANVVLGPSASYRISANEKFERTYHYNQTFTTANGTEEVTSDYEKISYAVTAGVGGEVSLGERRVLIDLRYKYGITPVKKSFSYIDINDVQGDLTSDSFYLTIGFGL